MKTIFITGVSTGIGYGAAKELSRHGYRVLGTVRRKQDGSRLQAELGENFIPLIIDVTDGPAIARLASQIEAICGNQGLDGLINNAGMAKGAPVLLQSMADFREQFEVNFFGLVAVTQALLPLLGATEHPKHPPGRIINISSVGGLIAAPFLASYAASKHAVEGFSHSLRRELMVFGIKVVILGPGSIKTAIWEKGGAHGANPAAGTVYEDSMQRFRDYAGQIEASGATPEEIGRFIREILEKPNPQPRYAFVPGRFFNWTLPRLLPHAWLDALLARNFGLKQRTV